MSRLDFEGVCLYRCAKKLFADASIARNKIDSERSTAPLYSCTEFFAYLEDAHDLVCEEVDRQRRYSVFSR
ncbi:hypothetical protein E5986_10640 [Adlercreutzia caecimuris]|uniref:Uncharacterized protein n=1 Tax=Adlercreutzia caecimuris TaxID=671266 RepID=A0A4S4G0P7_9ACTN|nr:hypothetical protein E5986_10640 [Adlercreutzia caecimuris]